MLQRQNSSPLPATSIEEENPSFISTLTKQISAPDLSLINTSINEVHQRRRSFSVNNTNEPLLEQLLPTVNVPSGPLLSSLSILSPQITIVETFYCPICLENADLNEGYSYKSCSKKHTYCKSCLITYLTIQIQEAIVNHHCPSSEQCGGSPSEEEIKELVGDEVYTKYLKFKATQKDANVRVCANCNKHHIGNKDQPLINCTCGRSFCFYHEFAHPNLSCEQYASYLKERHGKEEEKSESSIKKECKNCPNCHCATFKFSGCQHITCKNCTTHWCWLCNKDIGGLDKVTEHYMTGSCAGRQMEANIENLTGIVGFIWRVLIAFWPFCTEHFSPVVLSLMLSLFFFVRALLLPFVNLAAFLIVFAGIILLAVYYTFFQLAVVLSFSILLSPLFLVFNFFCGISFKKMCLIPVSIGSILTVVGAIIIQIVYLPLSLVFILFGMIVIWLNQINVRPTFALNTEWYFGILITPILPIYMQVLVAAAQQQQQQQINNNGDINNNNNNNNNNNYRVNVAPNEVVGGDVAVVNETHPLIPADVFV